MRRYELLDMHEAKHLVLAYEMGAVTGTMLFKPRPHIGGDADVQRSVPAAGENVDVVSAGPADESAKPGFGGYGSRPSPGRRLGLPNGPAVPAVCKPGSRR